MIFFNNSTYNTLILISLSPKRLAPNSHVPYNFSCISIASIYLSATGHEIVVWQPRTATAQEIDS